MLPWWILVKSSILPVHGRQVLGSGTVLLSDMLSSWEKSSSKAETRFLAHKSFSRLLSVQKVTSQSV